MMQMNSSRDGFLKSTMLFLVDQQLVQYEDRVVVVGGSFGTANGASFIEISSVRNLIDYAE